MTERGLPTVDGPVACPFVAFADDRDERSTSPDHRHRCYAEATPAPRALAHQEAYCLASAFPICPTFQDWARREAARTRADSPTTAGLPIPGLSDERPSGEPDDDVEPVYEDRPRRTGQKNWAAPPPWANRPDAAGASGAAGGSPRGAEVDGPNAGDAAVGGTAAGAAGAGAAGAAAGLSGSFADRLASPPESPARQRTPVWRNDDRWDDEPAAELDDPATDDEDLGGAAAAGAAMAGLGASRPDRAETEDAPPRRDRDRGAARDRDDSGRHETGPSWERPARLETFPSLRSQRMAISIPTLALAAIAVVVAALLLFFLPGLLGIGSGGGAGASPTPTTAASVAAASLEPTLVPEPTQQTYLVQAGDTMSKIAKKFGVPLQLLVDANKTTIPNPDKLKIGDPVIIPVVAPSEVPASSP